MADLFGILSSEKVNFIRDAAEREIDILKLNNKSVVASMQGEIKVKDQEVIRLKEELAQAKKKDDIKTKEIAKLKDEICELRKAADKNSGASNDREITVLKQDVSDLRELLRVRQEDNTVCNGKNKKTQVTNDGFRSDDLNSMPSSIGGPEKEKSDGVEWQTINRSKFSDPDVLIVGNSNVRKLNPRLFKPEFTVKHVLNDKTLSGAVNFLKNTDVSPRKSIVLQAIDNDIGNVTNDEIMSMIDQFKSVCEKRFPGVKLFVLEPLGRCTNGARLYWDRAGQICSRISSLAGIRVIKLPPSLKNADAVFYEHEREGFIHLNSEGIRVLTDVYRRVLIGERSVSGVRDPSSVRNFGDMRKNNVELRRVSRVSDAGMRKTTEVRRFHDKRDVGGSSDVASSDRECRITNGGGDDRFGHLINTLIEGLARFR